MRTRTGWRTLGLVLLGLALWPLAGAAQDGEVYRTVTPERLEKILAGLSIKYEKKDGTKAGVSTYDFKRDGQPLRLHNYGGQDLWIERVYPDKLTLKDVNQWNVGAKFSRAVLIKDGENSSVSLECQLDCLGGVTDAIIRRFITRFDAEAGRFAEKFGIK
jgi:hypothetical protein